MSEILNLDAVHSNGKARLTVGIRGQAFILELDSDNGTVLVKDPKTNKKLSLDLKDIVTESLLARIKLPESDTTLTGDEVMTYDPTDQTVSPSTIKLTELETEMNKVKLKADKAITLGGYGIRNAYTKTEIDAMLNEVMIYMGSYDTFAALETAVSTGAISPQAGWVYNIKNAGGMDADGYPIKAGDNVAYNGEGWDCLGGAFDTGDFVTYDDMNEFANSVWNELDYLYGSKADKSTTLAGYGITDAATYAELDELATTVSGKATKSTTLSGYGITDAYTKTEVDGKLSAVLTYKGTVASFSALPTSAEVGDVYNITTAGGVDSKGTAIKAGDNVAYYTTGWDVLGGTTDLSAYSTTTQMNTAISSAVSGKANSATTLSGYGIADAYTKAQTDTALREKADSATTLAGYGITNAYTKAETDTALSAKANTATSLSGYGITNAYTKTETTALIPTINISTSAPSSTASGKTGDLWIVYVT